MSDECQNSSIMSNKSSNGDEISNKKRLNNEDFDEISSSNKYSKVDSNEEAGNDTAKEPCSCFNICEALNLKDGDRIEVLWCLVEPNARDNEEEENGEHLESSTAPRQEETATEEEEKKRWWGATLLPPCQPPKYYTFSSDEDEDEEGEQEEKIEDTTTQPTTSGVTVPIRVLQYDPYIEGGYPESSCNEVAFISDRLVYDIELKDHLIFRREGSTWEPNDDDDADPLDTLNSTSTAATVATTSNIELAPSANNTRESLLPVLEGVLGNLLSKYQPKMSTLSADKQHWIADCVLQAKESLADKIMLQMEKCQSNVVTADLVKVCMEEVGKELALKGLR